MKSKRSLLKAVLCAGLGALGISKTSAQVFTPLGGFAAPNDEASGMVAWSADGSGRWLFTCDDEDTTIRRYDRTTLAPGVFQAGVAMLALPVDANLAGSAMDLEGATLIPDLLVPTDTGVIVSRSFILWTGSCSMNSDPARRKEREQLFLVQIVDPGGGAAPTLIMPNANPVGSRTAATGEFPAVTLPQVGGESPTLTMRDYLMNWDANNGHGLGANYLGLTAAGVNFEIEGIDYDIASKRVYLGFRGPMVGTGSRYTLIVPILNIFEMFGVGAPNTALASLPAPVFGTPHLLDLGARGVRDMCKGYILAGPGTGAPVGAPADWRLFRCSGMESAFGLVKPIELMNTPTLGGGPLAECLTCEYSGSAGGRLLVAFDESGAAGSRVYGFVSGGFQYYGYNLWGINYLEYYYLTDPFGAPQLVFRAWSRSGVNANVEVSTDSGATWGAPAGAVVTTPMVGAPGGSQVREYTIPFPAGLNRLAVYRASVVDGAIGARFPNAISLTRAVNGSAYRSAFNSHRGPTTHIGVSCPATGEAYTALYTFPDGAQRSGGSWSFAGPAATGYLWGHQGDLFNMGNDDGGDMFAVSSLDAGLITSQNSATQGSASPLGMCGLQLLPNAASPTLSGRLGAGGFGPGFQSRVGDVMYVYGDASQAAEGMAGYVYNGSGFTRTIPAGGLGNVAAIQLQSADTGVSYYGSRSGVSTRICFSSFWND